jgi:fatty acid desaturase
MGIRLQTDENTMINQWKKTNQLEKVQWADLLSLSKLEIYYELIIWLPWLLLSLFAAAYGFTILALGFSFVFFITGLRLNHNACHSAVGVSKKNNECVLFFLSILMLGSMHAVQVNHIRHHQFFPEPEDIEAMSAHKPAIIAFLIGPFFPIFLHIKALHVGSLSQKKWIVFELLMNAIWVFIVFAVLDYNFLKYHIAVMLLAQCMTAFFAVWTVHHDCDAQKHIARTVRNNFKAKITFNMFYHLEHHLYPAVPTCHLHLIAQRIDAAAPDLHKKQVF